MRFKHLLATESVTNIFTSFETVGSTHRMLSCDAIVAYTLCCAVAVAVAVLCVCVWMRLSGCGSAMMQCNIWDLWRPMCIAVLLASTFLTMLKCRLAGKELKTMCDLRLNFDHMVQKFKSMASKKKSSENRCNLCGIRLFNLF